MTTHAPTGPPMYHIVDQKGELVDYKHPTLCGRQVDFIATLNATQFYELMDKATCCPNCACHPDFAVLLLAEAGEDVGFSTSGTQTGRFSFTKPSSEQIRRNFEYKHTHRVFYEDK